MISLVDQGKWAPVIGRMFIAFGNIERTTHKCIREWAGEKIHRHFSNTRLAARIDLAKDLAESQNVTQPTKDAFCRAILQAKALAQHRNLIAHNPLSLVLLQGALDNSFLEAITHHSKDDKFLSYEELVAIVEETERCAEDLSSAHVMFRVEGIDLESLKHFPGL